jgi:ASC-1-like (ASCH) protein
MIERAIGIAIAIVITMILAFVFIQLFGAPTCASLANQTALQLKFAINEVADDSFPIFTPNDPSLDEPTDSRYYTTVPIRLCQKYGTFDFFRQFLGGMPEYQIYYEHFPEGGGGIWNEAYPWSGGAGSTLLFWGAMRGIAFAGKIAGKLTKIYIGWKGVQFIRQMRDFLQMKPWTYYKWTYHQTGFWKLLCKIIRAVSPPEFIRSGRQLKNITDIIEERQATYILKYLGEGNFISTAWDPVNEEVKYEAVGDKIVLKDAEIPVKITVIKRDGNDYKEVEQGLYVRCEQSECGGVLDPEQADWSDTPATYPGQSISDVVKDPQNYVQLTINPRQQMKELYEGLKETQPERAQEIIDNFAFDDTGKVMESNVTNASFIKKIMNENEKRIDEIKNYLQRNSYNMPTTDNSYTMQTGDEILHRIIALENITNLPDNDIIGVLSDGSNVLAKDFKEKILIPLLNEESYKFKDMIKTYASIYNIPISATVTPEDAVKVLRKIWEEEGGGFVFYHEADLTNIFVRIKDALVKSGGTATVNDIVNEVKKLRNYDSYFKIYEDHGRITEITTDLKNIYANVLATHLGATPQEIYDNFSFELELYQLKNIAIELGEVDKGLYGADNDKIKELIENQLGMIIGLFDKSDNTAPITLWSRSLKRFIASKIVFIKVLQFFAPNSWIIQGLILTQMTKKCRGNSICLYVHASQYEGPYYLSENATNYTVRLWRPVEPWKQWAGWTAAMMHVPSHPRFYVVSPCFAVAKVWKTNLDGELTVFVRPVKIDTEGSSNYCYADSNLINTYTTIWATADTATIVEIVLSWGVSSGRIVVKEWVEKAASVVSKYVDPITLVQSIAEAAISWPGPPYTGLNYTDMQEGSKNYEGFKELENALKSAYG